MAVPSRLSPPTISLPKTTLKKQNWRAKNKSQTRTIRAAADRFPSSNKPNGHRPSHRERDAKAFDREEDLERRRTKYSEQNWYWRSCKPTCTKRSPASKCQTSQKTRQRKSTHKAHWMFNTQGQEEKPNPRHNVASGACASAHHRVPPH